MTSRTNFRSRLSKHCVGAFVRPSPATMLLVASISFYSSVANAGLFAQSSCESYLSKHFPNPIVQTAAISHNRDYEAGEGNPMLVRLAVSEYLQLDASQSELSPGQTQFLRRYLQGNVSETDLSMNRILLNKIVQYSRTSGVLHRHELESSRGQSSALAVLDHQGHQGWFQRFWNKVASFFKGPKIHFSFTSQFVADLKSIETGNLEKNSKLRMKALARAIRENRIPQVLTLPEALYILSAVEEGNHNLNDSQKATLSNLLGRIDKTSFVELSYDKKLQLLQSLQYLTNASWVRAEIVLPRTEVKTDQFMQGLTSYSDLVAEDIQSRNNNQTKLFEYKVVLNEKQYGESQTMIANRLSSVRSGSIISFLNSCLTLEWHGYDHLIALLNKIAGDQEEKLDILSRLFQKNVTRDQARESLTIDKLIQLANVMPHYSDRVMRMVVEKSGLSLEEIAKDKLRAYDNFAQLLANSQVQGSRYLLDSLAPLGVKFLQSGTRIEIAKRYIEMCSILNGTALTLFNQQRSRLHMADPLQLSIDETIELSSWMQRNHHQNFTKPSLFLSTLLSYLTPKMGARFEDNLAIYRSVASTHEVRFTVSEMVDLLKVLKAQTAAEQMEVYTLIKANQGRMSLGVSAFQDHLKMVASLSLPILVEIYDQKAVTKSEFLSVPTELKKDLKALLLVNSQASLFKFDFDLTVDEVFSCAQKSDGTYDEALIERLILMNLKRNPSVDLARSVMNHHAAYSFTAAQKRHLESVISKIESELEKARVAAAAAAAARRSRGTRGRTVVRPVVVSEAQREANRRKFANSVQTRFEERVHHEDYQTHTPESSPGFGDLFESVATVIDTVLHSMPVNDESAATTGDAGSGDSSSSGSFFDELSNLINGSDSSGSTGSSSDDSSSSASSSDSGGIFSEIASIFDSTSASDSSGDSGTSSSSYDSGGSSSDWSSGSSDSGSSDSGSSYSSDSGSSDSGSSYSSDSSSSDSSYSSSDSGSSYSSDSSSYSDSGSSSGGSDW